MALVDAYQRGNLKELSDLGFKFAGDVAENLFAGELFKWKDEADGARKLAKAVEDPEMRDGLDAIAEKIDAIRIARDALKERDRAWFVETLRKELEELGNLQKFEATMRGVTVGGDIRESVVLTGDNNSVNYVVNQYLARSDRAANLVELSHEIGNYVAWVRERYGTIELRGIKREGQQVVQLPLEAVYIPLEAEVFELFARDAGTSFGSKSRWPGSIELSGVLGQGNRVIITGGPGSGKTTVLQHIAWVLAAAISSDNVALAEEKLGLQDSLPIPIFVPLSAYAGSLRQLPATSDPHECTLAAFITRYLVEKQSSFGLPLDFFHQLLSSGKGVILLLDGLDEVPNENDRARVREAIEDLVSGRDEIRVVVTCRTAAYKDRSALGKGFHEVRVRPLDDKHIKALVQQAYGHLHRHDPKTCQKKIEELLQGIRNLEEERGRRLGTAADRLVTSPLLVRMLLVVHFSERRLPDQRAELYMKATDAMLLPEYSLDQEVASRIGGMVGGSREMHRDLLQHLAFNMHRQGDSQGREIDEDNLRKLLSPS